MANAEINANFESVYEALCFEKLKCQDDPSLKAQTYRKLAAQQYFAASIADSADEHNACIAVYEQTVKDYFKIMDDKDPSKGLDNCSRGVQALCNGFKNESKQWHLKDLKNNTLFQKLEKELKQESAVSNSIHDLERTLDFVMKLEGKPQVPLEKPTPPPTMNIRSFGNDMDVDVHRSNSFVPNISRLSFQDKKVTEDHANNGPRFSLQEKRVPEDPPNNMLRFPYQERRISEEPSTNASRFSFQERKEGLEEPPKFNRPLMGGERKQEELFKPRHPSVIERKQEDIPRSRNFPEKRSDEPTKPNNPSAFRTAREQFIVDQKKKNSGNHGSNFNNNVPSYAPRSKSLGTRRTLNSPFVLPIKDANKSDDNEGGSNDSKNQNNADSEKPVDERLKNIEPKMIELIENEIMDSGAPVHWDDIAGLEFAKNTIKEIVVWPMLRPDIFTGLRGPPRGILLFGPPGTGKTLIGKCIASQSRSTFFSISASSLTSKWVGEGEKMVRALFAVARVHQPSVIFIDEIDSLLSQRSDTEHESSRRIKTEFLVQLDGATTSNDDRLLVVGATNRPQELDEAARRRLVKRLYIPLPEFAARKQIIHHLMGAQRHDLEEEQINEISRRTDGYSCADMTNLCKEAAFGPIRSISLEDIEYITADQVRPITCEDFEAALSQVRASVSTQDLALYEDWNGRYGSGAK